MDIETMATRRMRLRLRRAIGRQLLLLIVLWHFDGASREAGAAWGPVNKISAYVSSVATSKDVVILNHTTEVCSNLINFSLVYFRNSISYFPWPICWSPGTEVMSTSGDDVIYDGRQIAINSKDGCMAIKITTRARTYGRGEPIILKLVADQVIRLNYTGGGSGRLAVYGVTPQLEATKNGANIGAELPMLRISGNKSLGSGDDHYYARNYSVDSYKPSGNRVAMGLMFVACGLLFVLSSILVPKAVKRGYDPVYLCLAWVGGFISMVVPTVWWIWH